MSTLLVPTRANLLGAWSDQLCWKGPAAVVNVAIGWQDPEPDAYGPGPLGGRYPCAVVDGHFQTRVHGIGTGLGISSIRVAAEQYARDPENNYVHAALEWERINGVRGGWQDPVGAMSPGFKLIRTENHRTFDIQTKADHPIMGRMVLFDTKIRRPSRVIGEKVRTLMEAPGHFIDSLAIQVAKCERFFHQTSADWAVEAVLASWRLMVRYVPEMQVKMPRIPGSAGFSLVGAGGGGFGLMFTDGRATAEAVRQGLIERGYPAYIPVVLDGPRWVQEARPRPAIDLLRGTLRHDLAGVVR